MKKTIITMLIALVAICASAETYNYLKFTKTNGSTVTCSVAGIKVTYDNSNITVTNDEGTTTIALSDVQDMYFSNDAGDPTPGYIAGDVNADGEVPELPYVKVGEYEYGNAGVTLESAVKIVAEAVGYTFEICKDGTVVVFKGSRRGSDG